MKVTAASVAADGTIKARVKLTDPKGLPLDRLGVTTPGTVGVSFIAAYIPKGATQYTSYTTRTQVSSLTGVSAVQAAGENNGTWAQVAEGEYDYTFRTRAPQGFDKTVTHTIGIYGSRNLSEFEMGTQYDDDWLNFVPDGSPVTVVRDMIRMTSCNACHHDPGFHGGSRRSMEVCVLCHTPQTMDPDTGETVDMPVMTHKIHRGASLPSVVAGGSYKIIGNAGNVHDYSHVVFPADVRNCTVCHAAGPAQAEQFYKPTRDACKGCHDDVDFDTGKNHLDLPQRSDNQCANCHTRDGELEFDASINGAHTIPRFSKTLEGVVLDILEVNGAAPGKAPTVTFTIKNKAGNDIPLSTMARLNLVLAGPNTDYGFYVSEAALRATGPGDGRYFWTFARTLPADATGSWTIGIEGRRDAILMQGTTKQQTIREVGVNKTFAFSVDGSAVQPRRTVVSLEKCNACHFSLSFHGDNRNTIEQCVLCHNPNTQAGGTTVDFRVMVHRIHTGEELSQPYKLGNTLLSGATYPGDRRVCSACHVNGTENLPLAEGLLPVKDAASLLDPLPPATAACTGCHDSRAVLAHAASMTNSLGESCAACHGVNGEASVAKAHARQ